MLNFSKSVMKKKLIYILDGLRVSKSSFIMVKFVDNRQAEQAEDV